MNSFTYSFNLNTVTDYFKEANNLDNRSEKTLLSDNFYI